MLIVDGIRYKPWTPKNEEGEFHPLVKAQSKEIFGKDSIYFDVKTTLRSDSGIASIPDAYVIDLTEPFKWYVVENELATHPVYDHIVKQLTKFINGIDNQNSRAQILEMLYSQINREDGLRATVLSKTETSDVYHFLSKLMLKLPKIIVIIDEKTAEVEEACQALKYSPQIIEFKTFVSENTPQTYAHLFEPLYVETTGEGPKPIGPQPPRPTPFSSNVEGISEKIIESVSKLDSRIVVNQTSQYRSLKFKRIFAYIQTNYTKMHIIIMLSLDEGRNHPYP
jgi:hypothetical protein